MSGTEKMRADFDRSFEMSLVIHKSFNEQIKEILKREHWNSKIFRDCTGLDSMTFTRLMNKPDYKPNMRTLVTVCVAVGLDVVNTESLLKSLGLAFSPINRVHRAYLHLIENCKGMSIEDCNEILKSFGIGEKDLLGTIQRK